MKIKIKIDKDVLEKTLKNDFRPIEYIAEDLKVSSSVIYYYIRKYGIDLQERKIIKKEKGIKNVNYMEIPKEELYDLYINKGMTVIELSNKYYCSHATICYRLDDYGIQKRQTGRRKHV